MGGGSDMHLDQTAQQLKEPGVIADDLASTCHVARADMDWPAELLKVKFK